MRVKRFKWLLACSREEEVRRTAWKHTKRKTTRTDSQMLNVWNMNYENLKASQPLSLSTLMLENRMTNHKIWINANKTLKFMPFRSSHTVFGREDSFHGVRLDRNEWNCKNERTRERGIEKINISGWCKLFGSVSLTPERERSFVRRHRPRVTWKSIFHIIFMQRVPKHKKHYFSS